MDRVGHSLLTVSTSKWTGCVRDTHSTWPSVQTIRWWEMLLKCRYRRGRWQSDCKSKTATLGRYLNEKKPINSSPCFIGKLFAGRFKCLPVKSVWETLGMLSNESPLWCPGCEKPSVSTNRPGVLGPVESLWGSSWYDLLNIMTYNNCSFLFTSAFCYLVISSEDVGKTCQVNRINYRYNFGRFSYIYQLPSGTITFFRVFPPALLLCVYQWRNREMWSLSPPGVNVIVLTFRFQDLTLNR